MRLLLLFVILLEFNLNENAKILMNPSSVNSHIIYFSQLGKKLADQGHEVELLRSSSMKISMPFYKSKSTSGTFSHRLFNSNQTVHHKHEKTLPQLYLNVAMSQWSWSHFWNLIKMESGMWEFLEQDCLDVLRNKEQMRNISDSGFQYVIIDILAVNCRTLLPISLGIPYGIYSITWFAWLYRVPRLSSFTPFWSSRSTNVMNFYGRLTALMQEVGHAIVYENTNDYSNEFLPHGSKKITYTGLIEKASSWFFLEDLSVGYPNANMPNTVSIGDIMANNDIKPLPQDLENFVSGSMGCVIVSLGSYIDFLPDSATKHFCEAFRSFSTKLKFVWKQQKPLSEVCPDADNVMTLPWIPQNDLLAHPSVKSFITHGGLNSLIESVNHKKPVVILPLSIDQVTNAAMAQSKGYGISLSFVSFSAKNLIDAINVTIDDPSYRNKATFYSSILTDKPDKPEERVSRLINHVIKYGDKHLKSSAFQLSLPQFLMFDLVAFLIFIFVLIIIIFVLALWASVKLLKMLCCKTKESHKKSFAKKNQ